jgi:perosamine synthetase
MSSALRDRLGDIFTGHPRLRFEPARDEAATADWSRNVRLVVRRLLDYSPDDPPLVRVTEERSVGDIVMRRLVFATPQNGNFHATLSCPKSAKPSGAIVVLPGRRARHDQVIGLEPPDFPDRNVAERLTRANFASLTIDYGLNDVFPDDKLGGRDETGLVAHAMALQGRSLAALLTADAVGALRWLENEAWVDNSQIGVIGHSLGGYIALYAALAYEPRIPVVLASCAGLFRNIFERDVVGGGAHALPGILRHADLPDLMAALAPAFLQVQHGYGDPYVPFADAEATAERVAQSYDIQKVPHRFEAAWLQMAHGTDTAKAIEFFSKAFSEPSVRPLTPVPPARIRFSVEARRQALDRIDNAMFTGALTLGPCGTEFERHARAWTGTPDAVAVNSGTSAIETALRIVGVQGRRVLLPANTFFATASASLAAGADIGFVDIESEGLGIDPASLRRALQRHGDVAAVVPVHIGGIVSPKLKEVIALCAERGIAVIEDAAHALGSLFDGEKAGSFGRLAAFSLYPTKIITSAEGGLVATRDPADAVVARSLRDHGKRGFYANLHDRIGSNWRLSEVHAAIGLAHMESLGDFIDERRAAAHYYDERLGGLRALRPVPEPAGARSNYYKYMALLDRGIDRNALKEALRERHGVFLSGEVYDTLCCLQPALRGRFVADDFPTAYDFSQRHVCLPLFPGLTRTQQDRVVDALRREVDAQVHNQSADTLSEYRVGHASV